MFWILCYSPFPFAYCCSLFSSSFLLYGFFPALSYRHSFLEVSSFIVSTLLTICLLPVPCLKPDFYLAMSCLPAEATIKKICGCAFPSLFDLTSFLSIPQIIIMSSHSACKLFLSTFISIFHPVVTSGDTWLFTIIIYYYYTIISSFIVQLVTSGIFSHLNYLPLGSSFFWFSAGDFAFWALLHHVAFNCWSTFPHWYEYIIDIKTVLHLRTIADINIYIVY